MVWLRTFIIGLFVLAFSLAAAAADAKGKDKKPASPEEELALRMTSSTDFVPFFALAASTPKSKLMSGVVSADIGLEIADAALREQVKKNSPRFRAALRDALAEYVSVYYRPGRAPDLATLARLMQASVDRAAGKPGAKLYLVSVIVQLR